MQLKAWPATPAEEGLTGPAIADWKVNQALSQLMPALQALVECGFKGENMKTLASLLTLMFLLISGGCVPSLQPFYTNKDVIFEPSLLATWTDSKETWDFKKDSERGYKLAYTDDDGKQGEFMVHLFRVEGKNFLDLFPEKPDLRANDFYKNHLLRLHTLLLVLQIEPTLRITTVDPEWLKKFLGKNPAAVRHEKVADELVFTASSEELQQFLLTHLKTEGALSEPSDLIRKKL